MGTVSCAPYLKGTEVRMKLRVDMLFMLEGLCLFLGSSEKLASVILFLGVFYPVGSGRGVEERHIACNINYSKAYKSTGLKASQP